MDLRPGLAAARCPVLVLAGALDPLIPPDVTAEIVEALPDGLGELHIISDAAHEVLRDQPQARTRRSASSSNMSPPSANRSPRRPERVGPFISVTLGPIHLDTANQYWL
jgi:dienelactone hydrolase